MLNCSRLVPLVGVAAVVALAACGTDEGASSTTAVPIRPTHFVTIAPVETDPPGPTTLPERLDVEQEYTVVAGDFLVGIARRYDVPLDELVAYNGWISASDASLYPGDTVRIPPGARNPAVMAQQAPTVNDPGLLTVPPTPTLAGGQDNSGEGTYVIEQGDFPLKIANKFDVSLEALAAINGWEDFERDFPYPGAVIRIPPKSTD